jgi:hypothetical protein
MGELSAKCSARKSGGVQVTMKRRVHRDMNAIVAKVINPDSDIEIVENWSGDASRRTATYARSPSSENPSRSPRILNWKQRRKGLHLPDQAPGESQGAPDRWRHREVHDRRDRERVCIEELNYLADFLKKNK